MLRSRKEIKIQQFGELVLIGANLLGQY